MDFKTFMLIALVAAALAIIGIMIFGYTYNAVENYLDRRAAKKRKDEEQDERLLQIERNRRNGI